MTTVPTDGRAGVGGAGNGEMKYNEVLERALDKGGDGGHHLEARVRVWSSNLHPHQQAYTLLVHFSTLFNFS